ncbi:MAG TPA: UPF0164 family protein [Candidatus Polarisedimenticolia bacterium]|nr:UPF0164 family protein [Candidatus Polarisedimenticolia bacterium]
MTSLAPGLAGCAILLVLAAPVTPALAITDEEVFRHFRFNFLNPGARSLGLAGAFTAVADDATAAQANPAGMTNLGSPQFFLEVRHARLDSVDTPVSFRFPLNVDEGYNVSVRTQSDSVIIPSFVSYVRPFAGDRLYMGFSRQELLSNRSRTRSVYEVLEAGTGDLRISDGEIDIGLVSWNASLGWKLHENFRVGLTASYGELDARSAVVNTYVDPTGSQIGDPSLAGVPIGMYSTETDERDTDVTLGAGLLWRMGGVVIGGSYRQGGSFDLEEELLARNIDPNLIPGQIASRVFFNETGTFVTADNNTGHLGLSFRVPDVYSLGVSYRPTGSLLLAVDGSWIRYSMLLESFNARLNLLTVFFDPESEAAFTIDDVLNLHVGGEYRLPAIRQDLHLALRAGWHQDKDNRLRSNFEDGGIGLASNENFPGRESENHFALGLGLVKGNRFQLDIAADLSEPGTELVMSLTYMF